MRLFLLALFILLKIAAFGQKPQFVSAAPYTVEIEQPDGTKLLIKGFGDEYNHFSVTEDGYTVLKNRLGFYEYASLADDGTLKTSGIKARDAKNRTVRDRQFLRGISKFQSPTIEKSSLKSTTVAEAAAEFPPTGTRKTLMLLIKYPDLDLTYSPNDFDNMMNQSNYNGTGSFRDYYLEASNGNLSLSVDVYGWYVAENNYEYYGDENGDTRSRILVAEAIDAAEAAGVDFSQYDNDGDGEVDNLMVVHSGPGAEEGNRTQYIWSHRWTLGLFYRRNYDEVTINSYTIQPETRTYGMVGIGVFCHEFGHALDWPDLYDTDGSSEGLGKWCLMAYGSWLNNERTPAMVSAWAREEIGWITPTVISANGDYSLSPAATSTQCYKLTTQNSNEYFLLENRYKTGFDASLPGSGLAIFHVNTNESDNDNERSKLSDLEEADGKNDLDNQINNGDAGDLFPGTSENTAFNDQTSPSSLTYTSAHTGIDINNIYQSNSTLHFTLGSTEEGINLSFVPSSNSFSIDNYDVSFELEVKNNGDFTSETSNIGFYLSDNTTLTTSDYLLGTLSLAELDSGETIQKTFGVNILNKIPGLPEGSYYLGYIIDYQDLNDETDETDNSYLYLAKTVEHVLYPNLTYNTEANLLEITSAKINVDLQVENNGEKPSGTCNVGYYLSEDVNISGSDYFLGYSSLGQLAVNDTEKKSFTANIDEINGDINRGTYYIGYIIDYLNNNNELNESDNSFVFVNKMFDYCPPDVYEINREICEDESTFYNGTEYSEEGSFEFVFQNQYGCDSVIVLNITVHPKHDIHLNKIICRGESYSVGNAVYSQAGVYTQTLTNQYGCDSVVTLSLDVANPVEVTLNQSICEGESVRVGENSYSESGNYVNILTSAAGCDSTVTLNLQVNPESDTLLVRTICEGDSVVLGSDVFTETGVYSSLLKNVWGCDSLVTLDLTVNPSYSLMTGETICEGDTVWQGGVPYFESGIYAETYSTQLGCDSSFVFELRVNPAYDTLLEIALCEGESYQMGNTVYDETGVYSEMFTSTSGCDSVVTLDLKIYPAVDTLLSKSICEGDSVVIGNSIYYTSGSYKNILSSKYGCDSTVYLNLTVNPIQYMELSEDICEGTSYLFGDTELISSGIYEYTYNNQYGCDSVVTLNLNVVPLPVVDLGEDTILFSSETLTLDAGSENSSYLWNTGETSSAITVGSGDLGTQTYSVTVINKHLCSSSDEIVISFYDDSYSKQNQEILFKLFPNPTAGEVNLLLEDVSGSFDVRIFSETGFMVYTESFTSTADKFIQPLIVNFLTNGIYTVQIITNKGIASQNFVLLRN
ncbi:M6 family metalloprotease domain-containing protein [Maribellus maritimus]|uniref:M6 family metalloprotease domain-containing protein n=1 Tax=Maribellus maritimus TaxID=2870838 RepID=UPI001EEB1607|nr:M6 family metalloprotease domain-containing protein [Maribellus maritimus]MCG6186811.1 M6 family metalloprotease domain-containing protein [Maribellus maritimus]